MNRTVVVLAEAERELQETALWYEARREGLGGEFLGAVERVIADVAGGWCLRSRTGAARVLAQVFPGEAPASVVASCAIAAATRRAASLCAASLFAAASLRSL